MFRCQTSLCFSLFGNTVRSKEALENQVSKTKGKTKIVDNVRCLYWLTTTSNLPDSQYIISILPATSFLIHCHNILCTQCTKHYFSKFSFHITVGSMLNFAALWVHAVLSTHILTGLSNRKILHSSFSSFTANNDGLTTDNSLPTQFVEDKIQVVKDLSL